MRILCVSYDVNDPSSGSGRALQNLATRLSWSGFSVTVALSPSSFQMHDFDYVITQQWCAMKECVKLSIPVIFYVHGPGQAEQFIEHGGRPLHFITCSWDSIPVHLHPITSLMEPFPMIEDVQSERDVSNPECKYITLIGNDPHVKGTDYFMSMVHTCPDLSFLLVGPPPHGIPIPSNLTLRENIQDMREVYKVTRVIVSPSRWESFGRAVREGRMNGIPIITSDLPCFKSIPDVIIMKDWNTDRWIEAVRSVYNETFPSHSFEDVITVQMNDIIKAIVRPHFYTLDEDTGIRLLEGSPHVYWINVDERYDGTGMMPESVRRKRDMEALLHRYQIPNTRVEALTPSDLKIPSSIKPSHAACLSSHVKALRMFLESDQNECIVMEDDVTLDLISCWCESLRSIIDKRPVECRMLQLQYSTVSVPTMRYQKHEEYMVGAMAYWIDKIGAAEIISRYQKLDTIDRVADIFLYQSDNHHTYTFQYSLFTESDSNKSILHPEHEAVHKQYKQINKNYIITWRCNE